MYPEILKISIMLPMHKPEKDLPDPDAYQTINNLCTRDNIIEEYLKHHIQLAKDRHLSSFEH